MFGQSVEIVNHKSGGAREPDGGAASCERGVADAGGVPVRTAAGDFADDSLGRGSGWKISF